MFYNNLDINQYNKIHKIFHKGVYHTSDFELLFLGYNYHESYNYDPIKYVHGTHAYVINNKNITKEKIDKLFPIIKPIDVTLPNRFRSYIVNKIGINRHKTPGIFW